MKFIYFLPYNAVWQIIPKLSDLKQQSFVLMNAGWLRRLCTRLWWSGFACVACTWFGSPPSVTRPPWQVGCDIFFLWPWQRIIPTANHSACPCLCPICFFFFPGGTVVKNPPANAGDTGSIPGPARSHMPQSN